MDALIRWCSWCGEKLETPIWRTLDVVRRASIACHVWWGGGLVDVCRFEGGEEGCTSM